MKKSLLFVLFVFLYGCNTPYSLKKFREILNISKLQAPYSRFDPLYSVKYGQFKDVCNKYFYLQDNKYMAFYMCENNKDEHRRSELRFRKDFMIREFHFLKARLKIFPLNQKREFTFLQIHADDTLKNKPTINKPLLRIVWIKKYHNLNNHIWAIIRLGDKKYSKYTKIDLGEKPSDFFNIKIQINNDILSVQINGEKKLSLDVSYWDRYYNYFKAGVYLQDIGCAKVLFDYLQVN